MPSLVRIVIDGKPYELDEGSYKVEHLKKLAGIANEEVTRIIRLRFRGEGDQPVIIAARQYGEIATIGSVDELDIALYGAGFCHGVLSVVNIAAVSDRVNCDGVGFDRKQHAPVADAQPHWDKPPRPDPDLEKEK